MKKLARFFLRPYEEKKLIAQAMFWVIFFRACLSLLPYKLLRKFAPFDNQNHGDDVEVDWDVVRNVVRSVRVCSRYIPSASCLTQALATRSILLSKGQTCYLKIGVGRDDDDNFIAHAWIESNGRIIIGKSADIYRYTSLSGSKRQAV